MSLTSTLPNAYFFANITQKGKKLVGTTAIAETLEEIQTQCHHVSTGTEAQDFIQDNLVGITEVEVAFLQTSDWGYVEGIPYLVIEETIGHTNVVVVFKVVKPEFGVQIGHRPAVTFEQLEEDRRLNFQPAISVLGIPITSVNVIVAQLVWFKDRIERLQILIQKV